MAKLGGLALGLRAEFAEAYAKAPRKTLEELMAPGRIFHRDRCHVCLHTPSGRCSLHDTRNIVDMGEFHFWPPPVTTKCPDCEVVFTWDGHFRCVSCLWKAFEKQVTHGKNG